MGMTAGEILAKAQELLLDETGIHWPLEKLLGHLNDAQREVVNLRPDAGARVDAVRLDPGVKQTLPEGSLRLLDMPRNLVPAIRNRVNIAAVLEGASIAVELDNPRNNVTLFATLEDATVTIETTNVTPTRWLITSDQGTAHDVTLGGVGGWTGLPLPAGFTPTDIWSGVWPAVVLSDGASGFLIGGAGWVSGDFALGIASADGGANWATLTSDNALWANIPVDGVYALNKFTVSENVSSGPFVYSIHTSESGISGWGESNPAGADLTFRIGLCEHKGYIYAAVSASATQGIYIFRTSTLAPGSWTLMADLSEVDFYLNYGWLKSDGDRLYLISTGGILTYSDDNGSTWSPAAEFIVGAMGAISIVDVAVGNGYIVLAASNSVDLYIAPTSTMAFTAHTPTVPNPDFTKIRAVKYGGGRFVAVGNGGTILSFDPSTDPDAFTVEDGGFTSADTLNGIAFLGAPA